MAGDFSRSTINPVKHYAGVLMQQGRVQVDADWNEQLALQLYRTWTETRDLIGLCGTPKAGTGFAISSFAKGVDLRIGNGRYYVNGLLCEINPQSIPAWLPPASSPPSSPSNVVYQMTSGESLSTVMRKIELSASGSPGLRTLVAQFDCQIYIPSLTIDDRTLAVGDWVEISAAGGASVTAMVTEIGKSAAPNDANSIVPSYYPITVNASLNKLANAGRISLRRVVTFTTQPFLTNQWDASVETSPPRGPAQAVLSLPDGDYLVALEAWQREIDALEDSHIREVALGGPDTCERLQTVWQVHILPWSGESSPPGSPLPSPLPSPPSPPDCCSDFPAWDAYKATTRTTGLMNAQAPPPGNNLSPCQLPPSAGYLGLANQLYRVEIFQSGAFDGTAAGNATFVWSRDNAMVETPIVAVDSLGNVYVSSLGTDDLHSFELNDWVEIVDDDADLAGQPRFLAQISQPPPPAAQPPCASSAAAGVQGYCLNLQPGAPARFQNQTNLRLRRWDMLSSGMGVDGGTGNPIGIPITPGWLQLENNIQVNFSHGYYASRSYWQIPARTATGDIEWPPFQVPNSNPIPQPPLGPDHFFCRLALLCVRDGKIDVTDCRCTFPSLTSICADDICYQGSGCELSPVGTVAQALDELQAKYRMHNRTLHGSGVVCGLAVSCAGESQTRVRVSDGYAIDCNGYDLILDAPETVDLSSLITLSPQQSTIPDGEYELFLERTVLVPVAESNGSSDPCCSKTVPATNPSNECVQFRAIQCASETLADEILTGTLAMDFYTKCLQPWVSAFKAEYQQRYISSDKQVTDAQALFSALTNLVIQYVQPALTRDVYISRREAALLEDFYRFVLDRLSDSTYCSLRAGMRPFPEYSLDAPIDTIFGKGLMTRMRVLPTGHWAFACGAGPGLDIYDLATGQLAATVTPPIPGDATNWTLQDVAVSADGRSIYVIATGTNTQTNASDSFFAVGELNGASISWGIQGSAGAHAFVTLTTATQDEAVFASVQGSGIWAIGFADHVSVTQIAECNAIGQLVSLERTLYVTVNSEASSGGNFNQVQSYIAEINPTGGLAKPANTWPLAGVTGDLTDDLVVGTYAGAAGAELPAIFVSGLAASTSNKQVTVFDALQGSKQIGQVDLGVNTTVRMALQPSGASVLVSCESISSLISVSGAATALTQSTYAPVELHPTALAFAESSPSVNALYVLNSTANTISEMPATMAAFDAYPALEKYRIDALNAFIDLAGVLLENLKDCFCNLLLPTCASCDRSAPEGTGVGLACITIQNGVVAQICNLEKRKVVKSFSTVGYWLSLIPVIPLVKVMMEKFCCLALPAIFSKWAVSEPTFTKQPVPGAPTNLNAAVSGENLRYTMAQASKFNLSSAYSAVLQKSTPVGKLTLDSFVSQFSRPAAAAAAVSVSQVNGMTVDQAKTALQNANVQVAATETYNPSTFAQNLGDYVTAPSSVPPGSSVTLVVDSSNTVRYYIPTPPAVDQLNATVQTNQSAVETQINAANQAADQLQTRVATIETAEQPALQNIQSLQTLVGTLQNQLNTMQTSQASELALRDQQIAELTTTTQQLQTQLSTVTDLANQVKSIETRLPPAAG